MTAITRILYRLSSLTALVLLVACTHHGREEYLQQTKVSLENTSGNRLSHILMKQLCRTLGTGTRDVISVLTLHDRAMICGSVFSRQDVEFIDNLIKKLNNPKVINVTHVCKPVSLKQKNRDLFISNQLLYVLWRHRETLQADYKIYVQNAIIYIIGQAKSHKDKEKICELARMIPCNRKVIAYFTVSTKTEQSKKSNAPKRNEQKSAKPHDKKQENSERTTKVTHARNP